MSKRKEWLKSRPGDIKHVRSASEAICRKILDLKTGTKTEWLSERVADLEQNILNTSEYAMRITVRKALVDYKPGSVKPTEFQNVPAQLWAKFSFQSRIMGVTQAQLLAYFVITQGER